METTNQKSINTRYPEDVLEAIRILAASHIRSFNGEVIAGLRLYIDLHQEVIREWKSRFDQAPDSSR